MASIPLPRVLRPQRTSLEIERENFEKFQSQSISKAINALETPVKEKHVRSTIIGTFQEKGATTYWVVVLRLPLQDNRIVAWKFCIVTHKILREGHPKCVVHSQRHIPMMEDLGKLWVHLREGYGRLIQSYCSLLICKLKFHDRNPGIPGSLQLSPGDLDKIAENDVNNYFQLSVEIFDYQDAVIHLQTSIFESLDNTRTNSMTVSGQCRLSALVACVQESSVLYDAAVQLLFRLHNALPSDTLSGHRQRFHEQFTALRSFYRTARAMQYFRNLITIPELPDKPPNFLIQSELGAYVAPVALVPEPEPFSPEEQQLVDTSEASGSIMDFSVDVPDSSSREDTSELLHERDRFIEHLQNELARMRNEIHQLTMEHKRIVAMMHERSSIAESELASTKAELNNLHLEVRHLEDKLAEQLSKPNTSPELEARATSAEEKFQKLKSAYTQMREEHITLIRSKAEIERHAATSARIFAEREATFMEVLSRTEESALQKSSAEIEEVEKRAKEAALAEIEQREESLRQEIFEEQKLKEEKLREDLIAELESKYSAVIEETIARVRGEELRMRDEAVAKAVENVKASAESEKAVLVEDLVKKEEAKLVQFVSVVDSQMKQVESAKAEMAETLASKEELISELNERIQQLDSEKQMLSFKLSRSENSRLTMESDVQEALQQHEVIRETAQKELLSYQEKRRESERAEASRLLEMACITAGGGSAAALEAIALLEEQLAEAEGPDVRQLCGTVALVFTHGSASADVSSDHHAGDAVATASRELLVVAQQLCAEGTDAQNRESLKMAAAALRTALEALPASPVATAENVDEVMSNMDREIEEAATKIQQMLEESRARDTGLKLEVSESVLDSCTALMAAVRRLVTSARILQTMLGKKSNTGRDPYARNPLWAEGLISAARAVAAAARLLVTNADDAIKGEGKVSGVAGAAQEVAGSTARLVVASRVRAPPGAPALGELGAASAAVSAATAALLAAARSAAHDDDLEEAPLAAGPTAARRMEMEARVRALELETALDAERRRLAALRRRRYRLEQGRDPDDDWEKVENETQ